MVTYYAKSVRFSNTYNVDINDPDYAVHIFSI